MTAPLKSSMPQFTQLGSNVSILVEALDPATGDPVDGVAVGSVEIWADVEDASGGSGDLGDVPLPILIGLGNF